MNQAKQPTTTSPTYSSLQVKSTFLDEFCFGILCRLHTSVCQRLFGSLHEISLVEHFWTLLRATRTHSFSRIISKIDSYSFYFISLSFSRSFSLLHPFVLSLSFYRRSEVKIVFRRAARHRFEITVFHSHKKIRCSVLPFSISLFSSLCLSACVSTTR